MSLHYDYKIRWKNFRGFRDTDWVRIAPLTIVIGANNSGKSSLLAPLLLMRQTIQSKDANTALVTRGDSTDVGFYRDYAYRHDTNNEVEFGFQFHNHSREEGEELKSVGTYPPGEFQSTFRHGSSDQDLILKRYEVADLYGRQMIAIEQSDDGYLVDTSKIGELNEDEKAAVANARPINFLFSSSSALYYLSKVGSNSGEDHLELERASDAFHKYLAVASYAYEDIRRQFANMYYVGPHREHPKRAYEYYGDEPRDVGKDGQHFAEMLKRDDSGLLKSVNKWIRRLQIGREIEVDELSQNLFSVFLKSRSGKDRNNIADLGFGVSQILPVLVQLMAAREESLTIIKQPELHLNPKLQRGVADVFVDRAVSGRRVAIETHSEHILLRVRTLVAEGKIDPNEIAIYFVERWGFNSKVRTISVDEFGHIKPDEWPRDFMADKFNGALALASAQRKAKRSR